MHGRNKNDTPRRCAPCGVIITRPSALQRSMVLLLHYISAKRALLLSAQPGGPASAQRTGPADHATGGDSIGRPWRGLAGFAATSAYPRPRKGAVGAVFGGYDRIALRTVARALRVRY